MIVDENVEMPAADAGAAALRIGTSSPAMNAIIKQAAVANGYIPTDVPVGAVRQISGGIIPMDLQPFYSAGAQGFTTFTSTPFYHTPQDVPEHVDPASLTRVSAYLRDALIGLQAALPAALEKREVPSVKVRVPAKAPAGAAVPVEIEVSDVAGNPISGVPVRVLANQNDHWALVQDVATELGNGRFRSRSRRHHGRRPDERHGDGRSAGQDIAEGYATLDQTQGGLIASRPEPCTTKRVHGLDVRAPFGAGRITALNATITAGRVRVHGKHVEVDLRQAEMPATLSLTARTSSGQTLSQSREFRGCATAATIARAHSGM